MNRAELRANMMAEIDSHMDGVWQKLANDLLAYEQPGFTCSSVRWLGGRRP